MGYWPSDSHVRNRQKAQQSWSPIRICFRVGGDLLLFFISILFFLFFIYLKSSPTDDFVTLFLGYTIVSCWKKVLNVSQLWLLGTLFPQRRQRGNKTGGDEGD